AIVNGGCYAAQDSEEVSVAAARRIDLPFTLSMLPARMCTLKVSKGGGGGGVVTSDPKGIDCGPICSVDVAVGSQIKLMASPERRSYLSGWQGCQGTADCTFTVDGPRQVSVQFAPRICGAGGWCWDAPLPQGNVITDGLQS